MSISSSMSQTVELSFDLISRQSVTPNDADCQDAIAERLSKSGFVIEHMPFGDTKNLWARRGTAGPLFVFAGHTDVVPAGPAEAWTHPPFEPTIVDAHLYGRGAADMKTAIAAMVTAVERFIIGHPHHRGSIAFLLTSDEEGVATDGTVQVMRQLDQRGDRIDYCIVGEPSSVATVGDTLKNGRRGSMTGKLKVIGLQGHVAYPERAKNPIHMFAPALAELCAEVWDKGDKHFSATTMQFSNVHSGTGADNVVPGTLEGVFNFRFSPSVTAEQLQERTENILLKYGLKYEIEWRISGLPFLTPQGAFVEDVMAAIEEVAGVITQLSTSGGTSDARFIAPSGAQVIELGVVNATIHKVDENVAVGEIEVLSTIYQRVLEKVLV